MDDEKGKTAVSPARNIPDARKEKNASTIKAVVLVAKRLDKTRGRIVILTLLVLLLVVVAGYCSVTLHFLVVA